MKRRDVLRAAAVAPLLAGVRAQAAEAAAGPAADFPGDEKLTKSKREIAEAMARVRLTNEDAPDLLPHMRKRK